MEEEIFQKIRNKCHKSDSYSIRLASKEIAETFERFMEWLIKDKEVFYGTLSECYLLPRGDDDDITVNTLPDLFTYWNTNIKDK